MADIKREDAWIETSQGGFSGNPDLGEKLKAMVGAELDRRGIGHQGVPTDYVDQVARLVRNHFRDNSEVGEIKGEALDGLVSSGVERAIGNTERARGKESMSGQEPSAERLDGGEKVEAEPNLVRGGKLTDAARDAVAEAINAEMNPDLWSPGDRREAAARMEAALIKAAEEGHHITASGLDALVAQTKVDIARQSEPPRPQEDPVVGISLASREQEADLQRIADNPDMTAEQKSALLRAMDFKLEGAAQRIIDEEAQKAGLSPTQKQIVVAGIVDGYLLVDGWSKEKGLYPNGGMESAVIADRAELQGEIDKQIAIARGGRQAAPERGETPADELHAPKAEPPAGPKPAQGTLDVPEAGLPVIEVKDQATALAAIDAVVNGGNGDLAIKYTGKDGTPKTMKATNTPMTAEDLQKHGELLGTAMFEIAGSAGPLDNTSPLHTIRDRLGKAQAGEEADVLAGIRADIAQAKAEAVKSKESPAPAVATPTPPAPDEPGNHTPATAPVVAPPAPPAPDEPGNHAPATAPAVAPPAPPAPGESGNHTPAAGNAVGQQPASVGTPDRATTPPPPGQGDDRQPVSGSPGNDRVVDDAKNDRPQDTQQALEAIQGHIDKGYVVAEGTKTNQAAKAAVEKLAVELGAIDKADGNLTKAEVVAAQEKLNEKGAHLNLDGLVGPETLKAFRMHVSGGIEVKNQDVRPPHAGRQVKDNNQPFLA